MLGSGLLRIEDNSQTAEARRLATRLADELGFGEERVGAVALIVTEVAGNLLKHARRGELQIRAIHRPSPALEILAIDRGPGMSDPDACIADGFSSAGTPGTGLGAIRRMAATFDLYSQPGCGTVLAATISGSARPPLPQLGRFGVVEANAPHEQVCGDAWSVASNDGVVNLLVADGLGHGVFAAEASREAARIFSENSQLQPAPLLDLIHSALRSTRGAAAAIASVDHARARVTYAGIGNISGVVVAGAHSQQMISHNGTLGHQLRRIQEFQYAWKPDAVLIMHSDGLSARWSLPAYSGLQLHDPAVIAGVLYRDHVRTRDDASVVVWKDSR